MPQIFIWTSLYRLTKAGKPLEDEPWLHDEAAQPPETTEYDQAVALTLTNIDQGVFEPVILEIVTYNMGHTYLLAKKRQLAGILSILNFPSHVRTEAEVKQILSVMERSDLFMKLMVSDNTWWNIASNLRYVKYQRGETICQSGEGMIGLVLAGSCQSATFIPWEDDTTNRHHHHDKHAQDLNPPEKTMQDHAPSTKTMQHEVNSDRISTKFSNEVHHHHHLHAPHTFARNREKLEKAENETPPNPEKRELDEDTDPESTKSPKKKNKTKQKLETSENDEIVPVGFKSAVESNLLERIENDKNETCSDHKPEPLTTTANEEMVSVKADECLSANATTDMKLESRASTDITSSIQAVTQENNTTETDLAQDSVGFSQDLGSEKSTSTLTKEARDQSELLNRLGGAPRVSTSHYRVSSSAARQTPMSLMSSRPTTVVNPFPSLLAGTAEKTKSKENIDAVPYSTMTNNISITTKVEVNEGMTNSNKPDDDVPSLLDEECKEEQKKQIKPAAKSPRLHRHQVLYLFLFHISHL